MINRYVWIFVALLSVSCSKKEKEEIVIQKEEVTQAPYDTVAVDSFSQGATSEEVLRKIRMSSQAYQDSMMQAIKRQEEERKRLEEQKKNDEDPKKIETNSSTN